MSDDSSQNDENILETEQKSEIDTAPDSDLKLKGDKTEEDLSSNHSEVDKDLVEKSEKEENEPDVKFDREEMIKNLEVALRNKRDLAKKNRLLQAKLSHFFTVMKLELPEDNRPVPDQEDEYESNLKEIEALVVEIEKHKKELEELSNNFKTRFDKREDAIKEMNEGFFSLKKSVALAAVNSKTGRRLTEEQINFYLTREQLQDKLKRQLRVQYIEERNMLDKVAKLKHELYNTDECEININDFDRMVRDTYRDEINIEDKKKELRSLNRKILQTAGVLLLYKPELHSISKAKKTSNAFLKNFEKEATDIRNKFFAMKIQQESKIAKESATLQMKYMMLQNKAMLNDYEISKKKFADLTKELENLQKRYHDICAAMPKTNT